MTAAPDLDGWAITERLLKDLAPLAEPVWLVLDDVHELGSEMRTAASPAMGAWLGRDPRAGATRRERTCRRP